MLQHILLDQWWPVLARLRGFDLMLPYMRQRRWLGGLFA